MIMEPWGLCPYGFFENKDRFRNDQICDFAAGKKYDLPGA